MATRVDFKILDPQLLGFPRRRPAQHRANPCEQLGEGVRLHEIIVRPKFESLHSIPHAITGGKKEDRCMKSPRPQLRDDSPAVFFRQHHVDDQKSMSRRPRQLQPLFSVPGNFYCEAGLSQTLGKESSRLLVVFDQQNSHQEKHLFRIERKPIAIAALRQALSARLSTGEARQLDLMFGAGGAREISRWWKPPVCYKCEYQALEGRRKLRVAIPSPLRGPGAFAWPSRWFAPPANFRQPSGLKR